MITARLLGVPSGEAVFTKTGEYWFGTFWADASGKPSRMRFYRDGAYIGDGEFNSAVPERMRRGDSLHVTIWEDDPGVSQELRRALALAA